jgi:hypothetical protein
VDDGLPSSQVYDVVQDNYGYVWFSTDRGLSRYNGYEFENFDKSDGLTDNVVFDFLKLGNGDIWCTTVTSELFKITNRIPHFTPYKYNSKIKGNSDYYIPTAIYFNPDGDLFVRFHHRDGYLRISSSGNIMDTTTYRSDLLGYISKVLKDDKSEPFFFNNALNNSNVPAFDSLTIEKFTRAKNEAVHFENKGVSIFFGDDIILKGPKGIKEIKKRDKVIIASGKLNDSTFWVGYGGAGVELYNTEGELLNRLLKTKFVSQIYTDPQGNTWISTLNSGVYLQRKTNVKVLETNFDGEDRVHSLEENGENEIYIGYYSGRINKVGRDRISTVFSNPIESSPALIHHCKKSDITYFNSNHTIYSTKSDHLYYSDTKFMYIENDVIFQGNRSVVGVKNLKHISSLFTTSRIKDFIAFNGIYYAAGLKGLLYQSKKLKNNSPYKVLLKGRRIDALGIMDSMIIAASTGHGIFLLNKKHELIANITKDNGLSSNFASNVYVENDSTLWVCTNIGINKIEFDKNLNYTISKLDHSDGLLSNEIWDIIVVEDTVWVGTQSGVNFFSKDYIKTKRSTEANYFLHMKNIRVNSKAISSKKNGLSFDYDQNKIEFHFEGVNFQKKLNYRYMLIGLDTRWNYTNHRSAIYSSLPPGNYNLLLQTKCNNGKWSTNQINYSFTITPPYWKSFWFQASLGFLIVLVIFLFFNYRILSYNREIFREILRQLLKRLKRRQSPHIIIKHNGKKIKLVTSSIQFIKSSGNYLELHTDEKIYLTRLKIGDFINNVSDPLEFLRVHRSYIIRLDQVNQKSSKSVVIGTHEIPIGRKYWEEVDNIQL